MHYLSYYRMCPYQPAITYLAMTESITKKLELIKNQWWKQCPHQLHCVQRIYFWRVDISSHLHDYILLQWWWLSGEDISSLFSTFWTITTWLSVKKNSNQQRYRTNKYKFNTTDSVWIMETPEVLFSDAEKQDILWTKNHIHTITSKSCWSYYVKITQARTKSWDLSLSALTRPCVLLVRKLILKMHLLYMINCDRHYMDSLRLRLPTLALWFK